jgi:hypothetical protein
VRPIYATSSDSACVALVPRALVPAGGSLALPVRVRAHGASIGKHKASVAVHTDSKAQPALAVPVVYEVVERR